MLQDTRQDLQKCCQLGERHLLLHGKPSSYGENPVSFVNQFVEWMRSVAHQVGFEIDLNNSAGITDPHGDNQICMYSQALIVIDIMMHQEQVKSVSVVSFGAPDPIASDELCQLLKDRHIEEFAHTLAWILKMETLITVAKIPSDAWSVMEADLVGAYQIEQTRGENYALLQGHGIVERRAIALQITFYGTPVYLKKSQEEQKQIRFLHRWLTPAPDQEKFLYSPLCSVNRLFVTLQKYSWEQVLPTVSQLLPAQEDQGSPQWREASEDSQEGKETNVGFSLELDPPIPMSVHFYWLSKLTLVPSSGFTETSSVSSQNSYLSLLMEERDDEESWMKVVTERKSDIRVCENHSLTFSFSGPPTRAIRLCHIPFFHPRNLPSLLNPLRQQIVFNELIQSCIRPLPHLPSGVASPTSTVFEIVFEAPHKIELIFVRNGEFVQPKIIVEIGGIISVDFPGESEQVASQFLHGLQATHHIPLSLSRVISFENDAMTDL